MDSSPTPGISTTTLDAVAIRRQLQRLLESPYFSSSRRYPALLNYVVEKTLAGHGDELKERSLGIDVFHRAPDYQTSLDPVVRITAGEIRKRLAQYYDDPGHEQELRISLPSGSYLPEFHPAEQPHAEPAAAAEPLAARHKKTPGVLILFTLLVFLLLAAGWRYQSTHTPMQQFWAPLINSGGDVLVCVGQQGGSRIDFSSDDAVNANILARPGYTEKVILEDAAAAARLVAVLGRYGKPFYVQGSNTTDYPQMRKGPVILVAAGDNPWTMRITEPLRFHFVSESNGVLRIEDRKHPEIKDWAIDFLQPYSRQTQDYAIVGRFSDPTTGQVVVVAAGLGVNGTAAAGEFISEPSHLRQIARLAPLDWKKKNFEAVIATQVISEHAGPPRVLATNFW
jgi:hypothetical protein